MVFFLSARPNTNNSNWYVYICYICGVPQGSVLGPLLFLIYINDIQECSEKLKFFLFADDTNILYADKNLRSLELIVNHWGTLQTVRLANGEWTEPEC